MLEIGELRRLRDMGKLRGNPSQLYIWLICEQCGETRWVAVIKRMSKLCRNCYNNGQPLRRFWGKVRLTDIGCWDWLGEINNQGYGRIPIGKEKIFAHRFAFENLTGETISNGLQIDHLCRNRACVNPSHMEVVTCRVNVLRGISPSAKAAQQTHCKKGHPFDKNNTYFRKDKYGRQCRICKRTQAAERSKKRAEEAKDERTTKTN